MRTVLPSADAASSATETRGPSTEPFSLQQLMSLVVSGKGLRMALVAGAAFLAWKAFQGLRSLFWVAFGIAWVLFWTHGGSWR